MSPLQSDTCVMCMGTGYSFRELTKQWPKLVERVSALTEERDRLEQECSNLRKGVLTDRAKRDCSCDGESHSYDCPRHGRASWEYMTLFMKSGEEEAHAIHPSLLDHLREQVARAELAERSLQSMREALEHVEEFSSKGRTRYSRDRGEPNPTPPFPYEVVFSLDNYDLLQKAVSNLRAALSAPEGSMP